MTSLLFSGGNIKGEVFPTPSKSYTHRAFFIASLANGRSIISNPLISTDTCATLYACQSMGAKIDNKYKNNKIAIIGGDLHAPMDTVYVGNSGTTMRMFIGLCSMFDKQITITGDRSLEMRPIGPLLDALSRNGVICRSRNGFPPVTIIGPNIGGNFYINGSISSQYISSLMIMSPMLKKNSSITINGKIVSKPYLDITSNIMIKFGASIKRRKNIFQISGGTGYDPYDCSIPPDFSSAAFPLVAGALGGEVTILGVDTNDPQGDKFILEIIKKVGADVIVDGNNIMSSSNRLTGCNINMSKVPDLFPITAILLSTARGKSKLYGAPQLKFKESNRIKTVVNMINSIGGEAKMTDDGCIIHGKTHLHGGHIAHGGDHRIMMSAAVASIICDNPIIVDNVECCLVSYPNFLNHMRSLGMHIEEI